MFNYINEEQGTGTWKKLLTENFNVTDSEKAGWVAQYAAIHEIHESQTYATPLNTIGMGNPAMPQNPSVSSTLPGAEGNLWNQTKGSGDVPMSTLPMALNIALLTIGLELVPVIPAKGPWTLLTYLDFPYAGGKLGRVNETAFDGKGEGADNKPIYIKVTGSLAELASIGTALKALPAADRKNITVKGFAAASDTTAQYTFTGDFLGIGRNDGGIILKTVSCVNASSEAASIAEVFGCAVVKVNSTALPSANADFVQTSADLVDGFANFATGEKAAMTRAQNETGTGNVIGLRLFSQLVQMGSYEVTGTVTRQQLQDLPLYGVDAVGKVMEACQNEISQHINQRILERVFALGVTNAVEQKMIQGADLNLYLDADTNNTDTTLASFQMANYTDIYGVDHKTSAWTVKNAEALTSAENTHTRQRRIASRILAAASLIQTVGRRGPATWVVTNAKIASALRDISGYVVAPMTNTMSQDSSQNLFMAGTLAGLKVYVDPYMGWDDMRICVGRKGSDNDPGVKFLPYILADTVSITAEGTMAPKMLVNSRYAIAEAGFYPYLQYYTFGVYAPSFDFI